MQLAVPDGDVANNRGRSMSVLAGCATNGKVKPAKVSQKSFVAQGYSVVRFEDGRKGFIITEVPQMDEASRKDFERAVAMLNDQDYGQAIDILENHEPYPLPDGASEEMQAVIDAFESRLK